MKIELEEISISSFLNIAEEQKIVFDGPGVYAVIGQNKDDGGSNASGKSAFLRAITVLSQGSKFIDITNKEIKNRIVGLPPKISGTYRINNKKVEISRTIGGKLSVVVDGSVVDGKTEEIQEKLINLIGINPDHFVHLTHKMQEDFGGFLLMKDSEKKEFLGSFFDTSKIEKASENNDLKIRELTQSMSVSSSKLSSLSGSTAILKGEVDRLTKQISRYTSSDFLNEMADKKNCLSLKEKELSHLLDHQLDLNVIPAYLETVENLNKSEEELKEGEFLILTENKKLTEEALLLKSELSKPVIIPKEISERLHVINTVLQNNKQLNVKISNIKGQIQSSKLNETSAKQKIDSMSPGVCVMCGQTLNMDAFLDIKNKMTAELLKYQEGINTLQFQLEEIKSNLIEESSILSEKGELEMSVARIKSDMDSSNVKQKIQNIEKIIQINCDRINLQKNNIISLKNNINTIKNSAESQRQGAIKNLQSEISLIKSELATLEKEVVQSKELLQSVQQKYNEFSSSIAQIEASLKSSSDKLKIHSKISDILSRNGFVGYIFDGVLDEINREVNENIKDLAVISRLSMYFTPDHVAKTTGNISKSINYKIFDNSEEISFATLSGSEKESLLIAVDAAVDTVLCRRLGVDINYKILDEQFGWVDGIHKEPLIQFLKNKYPDKILLIVDHGSEFNAAIDKKIFAIKQNGMATLTCQTVL